MINLPLAFKMVSPAFFLSSAHAAFSNPCFQVLHPFCLRQCNNCAASCFRDAMSDCVVSAVRRSVAFSSLSTHSCKHEWAKHKTKRDEHTQDIPRSACVVSHRASEQRCRQDLLVQRQTKGARQWDGGRQILFSLNSGCRCTYTVKMSPHIGTGEGSYTQQGGLKKER